MSERERAAALLEAAVVSGDDSALREHLIRHSNLPGPRANLELARTVADRVGHLAVSRPGSAGRLWAIVAGWAAVDATAAPTGDPEEFLPFCATVCLGEFGARPDRSTATWEALARAANDSRWRMREAAAMAIRRLLVADPHTSWRVLERWTEEGGWLSLRAVAAGTAHPDLLAAPESVGAALALHRRIIRRMERSGSRDSAAFGTLRQGMGYTLSVLAEADPERGFALLERLARSGDRDLVWIAKSNLGKGRLTRRHPAEVERIRRIVEAG